MAKCNHFVGQLVLVEYDDHDLGDILIQGTIVDLVGNREDSHRVHAPSAEVPLSHWTEDSIFPLQTSIEDGDITYG